MSVISHCSICAGIVPLKQINSFRGRAETRGYFLNQRDKYPKHQSPACKFLCFTLQLLDPGLVSFPAVERKEMFPELWQPQHRQKCSSSCHVLKTQHKLNPEVLSQSFIITTRESFYRSYFTSSNKDLKTCSFSKVSTGHL